jgi:hypothetical protein
MAELFFKRKKYILGGIIIIAAGIVIAAGIIFFVLQERSHDNVLSLPDIAAPNGWYAHHLDTVSSSSFLIFTRDPVLPVRNATESGAYGEQIDVDVATTTFSAKDYIINEGFFDDPAGKVFDSNWSTLNERPLFTIRGEDAEGTDFKAEFLFASGTVYEFDLHPDDVKDYGDFQKIVNEVAGGLR